MVVSRIIAGRFGGRRLTTPEGRGTRPTSDRVREALFSRLDHLDVVEGAAVLDLFAGSGALGLEAVSRGATRAVLVDSDRRAIEACRRNVADLAVGASVQVRRQSVTTFLAGTPETFDLVLLDPPYNETEQHLSHVLTALMAGWLAPDALVIVERDARSVEPAWPIGLIGTQRRNYGETVMWFAEESRVGEPSEVTSPASADAAGAASGSTD